MGRVGEPPLITVFRLSPSPSPTEWMERSCRPWHGLVPWVLAGDASPFPHIFKNGLLNVTKLTSLADFRE